MGTWKQSPSCLYVNFGLYALVFDFDCAQCLEGEHKVGETGEIEAQCSNRARPQSSGQRARRVVLVGRGEVEGRQV